MFEKKESKIIYKNKKKYHKNIRKMFSYIFVENITDSSTLIVNPPFIKYYVLI